jgi:hypothetical protein
MRDEDALGGPCWPVSGRSLVERRRRDVGGFEFVVAMTLEKENTVLDCGLSATAISGHTPLLLHTRGNSDVIT